MTGGMLWFRVVGPGYVWGQNYGILYHIPTNYPPQNKAKVHPNAPSSGANFVNREI